MTVLNPITSLSRRATLAGLMALTATPALAAAGLREDQVAPDAMREDARLLRRAYEALHPGLLRYNTASGLGEAFDRLETGPAGGETLETWYLRLSLFLARLKCGHSYANFYNQSPAVRARLLERDDRLPFQFLWLGDRMIVTADPTETGLTPGTDIVTLNGQPAGAVLARLIQVARADGSNNAKRRQLMSVQGQDGYESFDVFYPLMFGSRTAHDLEVVGPDGRRRTLRVPAISLAARRAQGAVATQAADAPRWTMDRRGRTAVLTMNDWGLYDSPWDWRGWLDREMDSLATSDVDRLVVDIRANEGGLDCGDALAARLTDRTLAADSGRRLVRYRRIPDELRPVLDTWDRSFDDWGEDAQPFNARFLTLRRSADEGAAIVPKGPRFTGRVVLLTGPQNSSATFAFARMMKQEGLATLVGETTGGNRRGINGGAFYFLRLPATGLEVDVPLIGYFPKTPEPDAGTEPDILIPTTAEAIARGEDPAMQAAFTA